MTIIDRLVPTTYELRELHIFQNAGGDVVVRAHMMIRNVSETIIAKDFPEVTLTAQERQLLAAFVVSKLGDYETATGLARWVPPEPPQ